MGPVGPEAFAAAERDVPILLSVGYAACHRCHAIARESFEDDAYEAIVRTHHVLGDGYTTILHPGEETSASSRIPTSLSGAVPEVPFRVAR